MLLATGELPGGQGDVVGLRPVGGRVVVINQADCGGTTVLR